MKKTKIAGILLLSLILIFSLTACSSSEKTDAQEESTTEQEPSQEDTTAEEPAATEEAKPFVVGLFWSGSDADPAHDWNGWTLMRTASGETLVTLDENMDVVPQLADSWEVVDETTWKFHIRQGVKFSNGKDLTPEAVKSSLERVISIDERAKNSAKMESITVDGENIIFKTSEPYGSLVNNLSEPLFTIVDTDIDDETMAKTPVTTGPYQITSYEPKVGMTLVANEYYWNGKPGLDGYTVKVIEDDDSRALAMQSGEIQLTQRLPGTAIKTLTDSGDFDIQSTASLRVNYLGFNHENKFLSDIHLRRAFAAAINREAIAQILDGVPVGAIFPPSAGFGYDKIDVQKYDLELAKKELAEGGYVDSDGDGIVEKDGEKMSFALPVVSKNSTLAELMQGQLKEVGIDLQIELVENSYAQLTEENYNYDLFLTNYVTATTGDSKRFLEQNYTTEGTDNFGHYSNPKFDEVVQKLIAEFNPGKRIELSVEAQQIANDDVANVYIMSSMANTVSAKNVKNTKVFPMDYYLMTKDVTIE